MRIDFSVENAGGVRAIVVDGEVFDWGLDDSAMLEANRFSSSADVMKAVHADISEFFLKCLEEWIGFKVSLGEVNEAIKRGYLER